MCQSSSSKSQGLLVGWFALGSHFCGTSRLLPNGAGTGIMQRDESKKVPYSYCFVRRCLQPPDPSWCISLELEVDEESSSLHDDTDTAFYVVLLWIHKTKVTFIFALCKSFYGS